MFDSPIESRPWLAMEANLLLAKLHYIAAEFDSALQAISKAGIDAEADWRSVRSLRFLISSVFETATFTYVIVNSNVSFSSVHHNACRVFFAFFLSVRGC